MPTYYEILELNQNAAKQDIKAAFKRLALKYHPDHNPGSKTAEDRFKQINEAYQTLSDDTKKKNYDLGLELLKINPYHYTQYQHNNPTYRPPQQTYTPRDPYVNTYDPANYVSKSTKFKIKLFAGVFLIVTAFLGVLFHNYMTRLTAEGHYREALAFFKQEKYRAALIKIGFVFDYDVNHLDAHILRAKINSEIYHNYMMALDDYEFVIKHTKIPSAETYYKIGKCYFHLYDFDKAIAEFQKAVNLPEPPGEYYYFLAIAQIKSEKKHADVCDNLKMAKELGFREMEDEAVNYCKTGE